MKKKHIVLIIAAVLAVYGSFVAFILFDFFYSRYNEIDQVGMTYIWQESGIENEIGEVCHVGRQIKGIFNNEKTDDRRVIWYGASNDNHSAILKVTMEKTEDSWEVTSCEIMEIH